MVTEHEVRVIEPANADDIVDANDQEEMLAARIPLGNNPRKADYLSRRACGFSVRESEALAEVTHGTVLQWRRDDEEFCSWESVDRLAWLQSNVAFDLQQMKFNRNLDLCLRLDKKILCKANFNLNGMTQREADLVKIIRSHYKPQDVIAMRKALEPEPGHLPPGAYRETLTVTVEGREVEDQSSRQAAARSLLTKFTDNGHEEQKLIEGEVLEGD